jgi:hypothetical protein
LFVAGEALGVSSARIVPHRMLHLKDIVDMRIQMPGKTPDRP